MTRSWRPRPPTTSCSGTAWRSQALRAALPAGTPVGIALDPHPYRPIGDDAEPVADQLDAEHNRIYLDPVLQGAYPAAARAELLPPDESSRPATWS